MPTDAPAPPDSPSETGADGAARHQLTRHFERVAQALLRMSAQILSVCPELRDEHGCHCRRHHNPRCASRLVETLAEVVRTCERHLEHEQALLRANGLHTLQPGLWWQHLRDHADFMCHLHRIADAVEHVPTPQSMAEVLALFDQFWLEHCHARHPADLEVVRGR
ncbi:MAG: hypothetical protein H6945_04290 [Zoogloeaceae bacterium]|nr:hypothetical protein [Rhodocyclaceae bacterium]MCP5234941.1 hypothetical protein [Zoogloeaceae bacterium]